MNNFQIIMEFRAIFFELRWNDLYHILHDDFYFESTARKFHNKQDFIDASSQMTVIYEERELFKFQNQALDEFYFVVEHEFYGAKRHTAIVHSHFKLKDCKICYISLCGEPLPEQVLNSLYPNQAEVKQLVTS